MFKENRIINDLPYGETVIIVNGKKCRPDYYNYWRNILTRCYNKKELERHPQYRGCMPCVEWKTLSNFKNWFENQFYLKSWQLDKDLLKVGNHIYSPENCIMLPQSLNKLLTKRHNYQGEFKIGVTKRIYKKNDNCFVASVSCPDRGGVRLGRFTTEEEAHTAWRKEKGNIFIRESIKVKTLYQEIDKRVPERLEEIGEELLHSEKEVLDVY